MSDINPCPHDHTRMLGELRELPTPALGRLAQPVLERALSDPQDHQARESLRLLGEVLSERKAP